MNDDPSEEPIIAHWPGDWPGRQFVELDNVGDPGAWIAGQISSAEELLFDGSDDRDSSTELANAYINAADDNYFPLPTEFGVSEEEMRESAIEDFIGFIQEWRKRTIAEREQAQK